MCYCELRFDGKIKKLKRRLAFRWLALLLAVCRKDFVVVPVFWKEYEEEDTRKSCVACVCVCVWVGVWSGLA